MELEAGCWRCVIVIIVAYIFGFFVKGLCVEGCYGRSALWRVCVAVGWTTSATVPSFSRAFASPSLGLTRALAFLSAFLLLCLCRVALCCSLCLQVCAGRLPRVVSRPVFQALPYPAGTTISEVPIFESTDDSSMDRSTYSTTVWRGPPSLRPSRRSIYPGTVLIHSRSSCSRAEDLPSSPRSSVPGTTS